MNHEYTFFIICKFKITKLVFKNNSIKKKSEKINKIIIFCVVWKVYLVLPKCPFFHQFVYLMNYFSAVHTIPENRRNCQDHKHVKITKSESTFTLPDLTLTPAAYNKLMFWKACQQHLQVPMIIWNQIESFLTYNTSMDERFQTLSSYFSNFEI